MWSCSPRFVLVFWITYPTNSALDGKSLAELDLNLLRAYTLKVEDHLSDRTFNRFAKTFPNSSHETLKMTKKCVWSLAGFQPMRYSCCVNSWVCFVGPYENLTECPDCKEAWCGAHGKPRKYYDYLPVIPWLKAMSANAAHVEKIRYWAEFVHEPGVTKDIFNGSHYKSLLDSTVPAGAAHPLFYFSDEHDIALGLSTDGFAPFRKCKQTCWPIILFNWQPPSWSPFPEEVLHPCHHGPGSKKALGLGFILLATRSRTDSAGDGCQGFRRNQPFNIFTPRLSHPGIWWHSCHGSSHANERAEWHQFLSDMWN